MSWNTEALTEYGVTASHWEITTVYFDAIRGKADIGFSGWVSLDAKNSGAKPIVDSRVYIDATMNDSLRQEAITYLEDYISTTHPLFI